jgi:hypothetical protein
MPYPSLDTYFSYDMLKKEPWLSALGTNLHAAGSGSAFFMRIWIQDTILLNIHADPVLKHCFKVVSI